MASRCFVVMGWVLAHGIFAQEVVTRTDGKLDFRFSLVEVPNDYDTLCAVPRVEIGPEGLVKAVWDIPVDSVAFSCAEWSVSAAIVVEDMSFDGYSDFAVVEEPLYRYNS